MRGWRLVVGLAKGGQCRGADSEQDNEDAEQHGQAAALCESLEGLHFEVRASGGGAKNRNRASSRVWTVAPPSFGCYIKSQATDDY